MTGSEGARYFTLLKYSDCRISAFLAKFILLFSGAKQYLNVLHESQIDVPALPRTQSPNQSGRESRLRTKPKRARRQGRSNHRQAEPWTKPVSLRGGA